MTAGSTNDRAYWKWAGLGFEFAGVVGLFFYFGYLADRRYGSEPWGLLIGGAVGFTGGLYTLVKESYRMLAELDGSSGKPVGSERTKPDPSAGSASDPQEDRPE